MNMAGPTTTVGELELAQRERAAREQQILGAATEQAAREEAGNPGKDYSRRRPADMVPELG